jgi:hypothetical protein
MSTDRVLDRVRAANPAPAAVITDEELFAWIVAEPGDSRLVRPTRRRRARWLALIVAGVVFAGTGGALGLGVLSHASPKALFEADPQGQYSRRARLPGQITRGTGQTVIASTVHLATTFTIPGFGRFQWWIAISRPSGWLCGAIRQPDGTWADLGTPGDKYQLGGPVPGCGTLPWHDAEGFAYNQSAAQTPDGRVWRIAYGYTPTTGHPVEIRDKVSGATVPIGDGRYFAIVMPQNRPGYQLQTLDRAGHVLVTDQFDPGE